MAFGKKVAEASSAKKFTYKPKTADAYKERASQQGGNFDSPIQQLFKVYTPKAGDQEIRILPPTWDDAKHFGLETWLHYGIGADGGTYVCLHKMKAEDCALCDARVTAEKNEEDDLAAALKPGKRIALWVIDRAAEKEGPKIWLAPWTLERDICALAVDKKSGEVYQLDDPENGYDVSFTVVGEKLSKKYTAAQIARRATPLHDDEDTANTWLEFISEHPLPSCLIYQTNEYLESQLSGGVRTDDKKDDVKEEKASAKPKLGAKKPAADEPAPSRPKLGRKPEVKPEPVDEVPEDLNWADVHAMDEDTLLALCDDVKLDPADCPDGVEPADWVCAQLELEDPTPKAAPAKPSFKDKLAAMRAKAK